MTVEHHLDGAAKIALTLTFRGNPVRKVGISGMLVIETGIHTLHFADVYEKDGVNIAKLNKSNPSLCFSTSQIAAEWPLEV